MQHLLPYAYTQRVVPSQIPRNIKNKRIDDLTPRKNNHDHGKKKAEKEAEKCRRQRRRQILYSVLCCTAGLLATIAGVLVAYLLTILMSTPIGISCTPNCMNNGTCTSNDICQCSSGYNGSYCQTPICNQPCIHGNCTAPDVCTCASGYSGSTCATPNCSSNCINGTCSAPNTCTCASGYNGSLCQFPICSSACQNNGTCTAPNTCTCLAGYNGAVCQYPQTTTSTVTTSTTATTTTATTTTTTTTITCFASGTTTHAPGGQGGQSVIYTFDNTANDYYGNYNAVPVNSPQYVSPGYNGRGYAIQLLASQSQCLTIANHMDFYQRSLTVEAWIYPFTIPISNSYADMIIYSQTNASLLYQYMWVMLRNGNSYGAFFNDDVSGSTLFQVNQWQHIAFTYDYANQTQVAYINGVADGVHRNASPCLITAGTQAIGAYSSLNAGYFDGYIDQLEILFGVAKTAAQILDDATMVVYFTMDCLSYLVWDSGPNQITGTAVGLSTGDGGRVGQSYLFNTNSSYFQVTGLVLIGQSYSSFSFAMWLRPISSVTNGGTILHLSEYTNGIGWCVQFMGLSSTGQIIAHGYNASGMVQVTGPVLTVDQWVHIVETYSSTNGIRLYVNGVLYGQSSPFVYASSGVPMTITLGNPLSGAACDHTGILPGYYQGQIDEFYLYSRELAQADVTALANP